MLQVINDPYSSRAASFGASLGTGLGSGLQALAEHKIERMLEAKNIKKKEEQLDILARGAEQSHNLPPHVARSVVRAYGHDPKLLAFALKSASENQPYNPQENNQQQYNQQYAQPLYQPPQQDQGLAQLQELQQQQNMQQAYQPQNGLADLGGGYAGKQIQDLLNQEAQQQGLSQQQQATTQSNPLQQLQMQQNLPVNQPGMLQRPNLNGLTRKDAEAKIKEFKEEYKAVQKADNVQRKEEHKAAVKWVDNLRSESQKEEKIEKRIGSLEKLEKTGKLTTQKYLALLKARGIEDTSGYVSPETEVYNKEIEAWISDIAQSGNLTDEARNSLARSVPRLAQTPEARKQLYATFKYNAAIKKQERVVADKVIRENGGRIPTDIQSQVESQVAPIKIALQAKMEAAINRALTAEEKQQGSTPEAVEAAGIIGSAMQLPGQIAGKLPSLVGGVLGGLAGGKFFGK